MKLKTAYISDVGGREKNDDTVRISEQPEGICVFVGDGLGGYDGGKIASSTAAEVIGEYAKNGNILDELQMQKAVKMANEAVFEQQKTRRNQMKTTLVVLSIEKENARWMHVGDSRLYHFSDGKLKFQTMDHSVSQVAVLMGEISQSEIRFHEDRNRVLRALGSENAKPDISPVMKLSEEREAFLLCTDGFWEYVYENEMEQTLQAAKSPQEWLKEMLKLLKMRVPKDNDNFSAAVIFADRESKHTDEGR